MTSSEPFPTKISLSFNLKCFAIADFNLSEEEFGYIRKCSASKFLSALITSGEGG